MSSAAGYTVVYAGLLAVLAGVVLYVFVKALREQAGQIPAPADIAGTAATPTHPAANRGHLRGLLGGRHPHSSHQKSRTGHGENPQERS